MPPKTNFRGHKLTQNKVQKKIKIERSRERMIFIKKTFESLRLTRFDIPHEILSPISAPNLPLRRSSLITDGSSSKENRSDSSDSENRYISTNVSSDDSAAIVQASQWRRR